MQVIGLRAPRKVSVADPPPVRGALSLLGHIIPFARNPYRLMQRVADAHCEIASFTLFRQCVALFTGEDASKRFYRASDAQLDQSAAYILMTPIFGGGLVFDAPIERRNAPLRMVSIALAGGQRGRARQ